MTADTSRRPLTPRERRIYAFLRERWRERRRGPSIRELMVACGHRTSSATHIALVRLEAAGYVRRFDVNRGWVALDAIGAPCSGESRYELVAHNGAGMPVYALRRSKPGTGPMRRRDRNGD